MVSIDCCIDGLTAVAKIIPYTQADEGRKIADEIRNKEVPVLRQGVHNEETEESVLFRPVPVPQLSGQPSARHPGAMA
jgi:hypothetical protein